jgi:hypothetical protein
LLASRIENGQLIDEIIQGGAQVIGDFTNENAPAKGKALKLLNKTLIMRVYAYLASVSIELEGNIILLRIGKSTDTSFQIRQVFTCPIYPQISPIKPMHMLYYPQEENHGRKETKDTKDTQGARDSRAHI